MTFSVKVNPLLAYLLKRKAIKLGPQLGILLGLWSISLILLDTPVSGIYLSAGYSFGFLFRLLCTIAYPLIMLFPVLCAFLAAQPSRYTSGDAHREMLLLTYVTNDDMIWTHIVAVLYPMRWALAVFLGVSPMSFIVVSLIWAIIQSQLSYTDCVSTFTGGLYCGVSYLPKPILRLGDLLPVSLAILALAVGGAGIYLLVTAIGAILAIYQKYRVVAVVVSGSFALAASFYMVGVIVPDITLKSLIDRSTDLITVLDALLIALLPFALTFGLIRVTSHLVRRMA